MATTGGKVCYRQPLAFADGNVSIGDVNTLADATAVHAVLIGGSSSVAAGSNRTVAIGHAVVASGDDNVVIGSGQTLTPTIAQVVAIGYSSSVGNPAGGTAAVAIGNSLSIMHANYQVLVGSAC